MIGYAEDRSTLRVHNCNDQLGWNLPLPDGKGATNRPSARPNPLSINLPGARRGRASSRDVVPRVPLQEIVPGLVRESLCSARLAKSNEALPAAPECCRYRNRNVGIQFSANRFFALR